ncbi:MAG: hypothetical protein KJ025_00125 [Burkholderiales bacterium]|nr:hypothetical protein [Burkholderiales bacterium]
MTHAADPMAAIRYDEASSMPAPEFAPVGSGGAGLRAPATVLAQSRDELFGLPPAKPAPDRPAAKPEPDRGFRLSGFYGLQPAYTYAKPTHWSRAVNRFQLEATGSLGNQVKWKLGGRADIDPVYYGSDFYLDRVKHDQRTDFFWRENYIDFGVGDWAFRVGAQQIVWGEVVGLFFADVVSARDQREFVLPSFDIIRIPQGAVRAEYFKGDSHLELVWIPVPAFDNIGKPGSDFYPVPLPSPTPEAAANQFLDPNRPARTLRNANYGLRANTLIEGWDLAAFYYRSYSAQPTFYRLPTAAGQPLLFEPRYDRIWQAGGTLSKDFRTFVLKAEAIYTGPRNYASNDPTAPQGVLERRALDWIVGIDVPFQNDVRLNVQGFQRLYFGGSDDQIALDAGRFGASVLISGKIAKLEPQILYIQTFGGGGGLIRPRVDWRLTPNTRLGFGVDIFTGPIDGLFGRYDNRDRIYSELRHDF